MEIIIGIVAVVIIIVVLGKIKGAPKSESLSIQALLNRIQSEEAWIRKYKTLPFSNQQGAGIKKQYEGKVIYIKELQLEFMKRGLVAQNKNLDETLVPVLYRQIELMKTGIAEDEAMNQASSEFVSAREAKADEPTETVQKT